jgi:hypothetical protein
MPRTYEELLAIFRRLGARDPEGWARSEAEEGIPQLAAFLFLRQAWKTCVIAEGDVRWIREARRSAKKEPNAPLAGVGHALDRLLAKGANARDLAELVRGMQYETLFSVCSLLSDPGELDPEVQDVCWSLFECDASRSPARPMDGLHESVLGTDPTGREMRPNPGKRKSTR